MGSRFVALLLAMVLAWSGLTTQEQIVSMALTGGEQAMGFSTGASTHEAGSVADHHLDDVPAQAHVEHAADAQGVAPRYADLIGTAAKAPWPRAWPAVEHAWPFLDGPQRPPCAAALTA